MAFGVTSTGFNCPTEADLLAQIEADQRADIAPSLDLSEGTVLGASNRIVARYLAQAWQALAAVHDGNDPDAVTDDQATSLAKITGTERRGASSSEVDLTVVLEKDTQLIAGQHFAQVAGKPQLRFTPKLDFTAPSDVSVTRFRAEQTGPLDTPINSIDTIATPVVGWTRIAAGGEVSIGRDVDTDADLHVRRLQDLARSGGSTTAGVRSDLLALSSATAVSVFENYGDSTDANGLPPKSFECIVEAADSSDDQIAQAIWGSKPSGILPVGSSSGRAVDAAGNPHVMRFTRPLQVPVYISYSITRLGGYVGDETFAATVATRLDASLLPGAAVESYDVSDAAHGLGARVTSVAFGLSPAPTARVSIAVGARAIARFDAGRVVLT